MLADAGGNDGVVFHVLGHDAEFLDNRLRFDEAVLGFAFVQAEGKALFPIDDLGEPFFAGGFLLDVGKEEGEVGGDVAFDGFGGLDNFVEVLGHDFEMDDSATFFGGGGSGLWGEFGDVTSDAVVEAGAEGDDQVSFLYSHIGVRRTVHAEHVEGLLIKLIETAEALESGCDRYSGLFY